jgi:vacuolar iron transporter family protein
VVWSVVLTCIASLGVGAIVGRSGSGNPARSALRQLAIVVLAAAVTYGIGKLFGTAIS